MKCLKTSILALYSIGTLVAAADGALAAAADGLPHVYRGSLVCKGTGGGSLALNAKGQIQNRGTNVVYIDCPLPAAEAGWSIVGVVFTGVDNSSLAGNAGSLRCKAVAANMIGTAETSGAYVGSTGSGVNVAQEVVLPTGYTNGTYALRCDVPYRATGDGISTFGNVIVYTAAPAL